MEIKFSDNGVKCKGRVPSVYTLWGEVLNPWWMFLADGLLSKEDQQTV